MIMEYKLLSTTGKHALVVGEHERLLEVLHLLLSTVPSRALIPVLLAEKDLTIEEVEELVDGLRVLIATSLPFTRDGVLALFNNLHDGINGASAYKNTTPSL